MEDEVTWVDPKERKPAKFGRYLICQHYSGIFTGWYLPRYDSWIGDDRHKINPETVTGWQDLPKRQLPPGLSQKSADEIERMVEDAVVDIDLEFVLNNNITLPE